MIFFLGPYDHILRQYEHVSEVNISLPSVYCILIQAIKFIFSREIEFRNKCVNGGKGILGKLHQTYILPH